MTGDSRAAEDMVQEVFMRILLVTENVRDEGKLETWLFRIARTRGDYSDSAPVEGLGDEALESPEPQRAGRADRGGADRRAWTALSSCARTRASCCLARYRECSMSGSPRS